MSYQSYVQPQVDGHIAVYGHLLRRLFQQSDAQQMQYTRIGWNNKSACMRCYVWHPVIGGCIRCRRFVRIVRSNMTASDQPSVS